MKCRSMRHLMEIFNYVCEIFRLLITTVRRGSINFKAQYISKQISSKSEKYLIKCLNRKRQLPRESVQQLLTTTKSDVTQSCPNQFNLKELAK